MQDVKYLIDENGVKTNVILNLEEYYALLEEIEDLRAIAERKDEEIIPHSIVKDTLTKYE